MKKIMLSVLLGLALTACSSGNSDNPKPNPSDSGGPVTEFGQTIAGNWLSECTRDQNGFYKETMMLQANGKGSSTQTYFRTQDCSGQPQVQAPVNFSYTSQAPINGVTAVTLTTEDGRAVQVRVAVKTNNLEISSDRQTVRYVRIGQTPGQIPDGNLNDFDSMAAGNWYSEQCYPGNNGNSAREILSIRGQGQASSVYNVYQSADCSGEPQAQQPQQFSYTVVRFANGGGQISVNGTATDVTFQTGRMTLNSAQGSATYIRIN